YLRDGDASGLLERLVQEGVRFLRRFLRFEVVGRLVIERAGELLILDESGDIDGLARAKGKLLEILVGELDVVALLVFVSAHDVAPRNLVIALDAPPFVLDAAPVLRAKKIERHLAGALGREIQAHRDGDHPEAHDAFPNRSWHSQSPREPLCFFRPASRAIVTARSRKRKRSAT